jgi:hypothetical protein
MATINMLRGLLVAGAVLAVIVAAAYQQWAAVGILTLGIVAHALLWVHLHRHPSPPEPRG